MCSRMGRVVPGAHRHRLRGVPAGSGHGRARFRRVEQDAQASVGAAQHRCVQRVAGLRLVSRSRKL